MDVVYRKFVDYARFILCFYIFKILHLLSTLPCSYSVKNRKMT